MSSVPFAIRLPKQLATLIERFGNTAGKSTADSVRLGIEHAFSNEHRVQLIAHISDRPATVQRVRDFLDQHQEAPGTSLSAAVYSALMCFWHWAYKRHNGYATPVYMDALLTITSDLLVEAQRMHMNVDFSFYRNTLKIEPSEDIANGISRIKADFRKNPSIRYAEVLTRPLEGMADDLQHFLPDVLGTIFHRHLQLLMPLTIAGSHSGMNTSGYEQFISKDVASFLPRKETFQIGGITFILSAKPLALVVEEGHHRNAFGHGDVIGMHKWVEHGHWDQDESFQRDELHILSHSSDSSVEIHNGGGYRLFLSYTEFHELVDVLKAIMAKPKWQWLIARYKDLMGDV